MFAIISRELDGAIESHLQSTLLLILRYCDADQYHGSKDKGLQSYSFVREKIGEDDTKKWNEIDEQDLFG